MRQELKKLKLLLPARTQTLPRNDTLTSLVCSREHTRATPLRRVPRSNGATIPSCTPAQLAHSPRGDGMTSPRVTLFRLQLCGPVCALSYCSCRHSITWATPPAPVPAFHGAVWPPPQKSPQRPPTSPPRRTKRRGLARGLAAHRTALRRSSRRLPILPPPH